ncbi:uncharacterized protein LOC111599838 [Drosophila hydei]|uniref:Uncharacterized protein LOC111599838 n=1 Tax=Drosophila hydei TaxID=7224 RepID=A0A6J1LW34_DROHY|nr:uncharacterized protein LOC111599838 [Drosophila hydei]
MKSTKALHKFVPLLLLLLLLLLVDVWSHPMPDVTESQQSMLLIQNNVRPEDAKNYEIAMPKEPKPGEPCLTISWKTNPDGTGPEDPQIYLVNGYLKIMTQSQAANIRQ